MTTLTCAARAPCDGRALAWLSTIAGTASILFTYLLGARLVGPRAALLAAAFTVTSPLQLALGRRALQDEVYCAVFLAAFWALVRLVQDDGEAARHQLRRGVVFVFAAALAFAVKEAFVFPYLGLFAVFLLATRGRRLRLSNVLLFAAPPLLFFAGFALLGRSPSAFFELLGLVRASFFSEYSAQYQSGPPHRPLFDLFVIAPIVAVLAVAAFARIVEGRRGAGGERWLALFLVITLAAFMGLPKNLRFVVILDPILRLLAAWAVCVFSWGGRSPGPRWAAVVALVNAVPELGLFHAVFVEQGIYDPTTHDVLYALGAIPHAAARPQPSAWPFYVFAGLAIVVALVLATRRGVVMEPKEPVEKAPPPVTQAPHRGSTIALGVAAIAAVVAFYVWSSSGARGREGGKDGLMPVVSTPGAETLATPNPAPLPRTQGDAMALGLEALYTKRDPVTAAARFREVLAQNPEHYGATFQLATALDQAGDQRGARPVWTKMLVMAEAIKDTKTAEAARARITALDEVLPKEPAEADPDAAAMKVGLEALYKNRDPAAAVEAFRKVLARNPEHYGATFQLATALDQAGKRDDALKVWSKVLVMAEAIKDTKTAEAARTRLKK